MSADLSARSVSRTEGVDRVRALQRVLFRSAKQQPGRRFHALYDKLSRRDVMWRAWSDVRSNGGAPGVDGVTIGEIDALAPIIHAGAVVGLSAAFSRLRIGWWGVSEPVTAVRALLM